MQWYVVYCKPRQESQAVENLLNQDFEAVFPRVRVKRRRSTGRVKVVEAMFPRYVFVQLAEGIHDFSKIRSTRGCVDLVRFGGKPTPIPKGFLESLSATSNDEGVLDLTETKLQGFKAGQKARVADGAFEGLLVEIAELKADDRALVLMEVMGGTRKVVVSLDSLEKS